MFVDDSVWEEPTEWDRLWRISWTELLIMNAAWKDLNDEIMKAFWNYSISSK